MQPKDEAEERIADFQVGGKEASERRVRLILEGRKKKGGA